MRVVFMGTPDAAVPSLVALHEAFDVVAAYTRPDRPRGRGLQMEASPVKAEATRLGLELRQPARLRGEAEPLQALGPDVIAVVAYGALLPTDILEIPRLGCVNVHFSLLPRWRGAAPVERAIEAGDARTGVTTMLMDAGMDTGPVLVQETVDIDPDDTSESLRRKLANMGAPLLVRTVRELASGSLVPVPQRDEDATMAPKVDPGEAELDTTQPAVDLERKIRAFYPRAFVRFRGRRLQIRRAEVEEGRTLRLLEVQPEGKRAMSGDEFMRGYRPQPDELPGARV